MKDSINFEYLPSHLTLPRMSRKENERGTSFENNICFGYSDEIV